MIIVKSKLSKIIMDILHSFFNIFMINRLNAFLFSCDNPTSDPTLPSSEGISDIWFRRR